MNLLSLHTYVHEVPGDPLRTLGATCGIRSTAFLTTFREYKANLPVVNQKEHQGGV